MNDLDRLLQLTTKHCGPHELSPLCEICTEIMELVKKCKTSLKLQELVEKEISIQQKRLRSQPRNVKAPISCLEACNKLLRSLVDVAKKEGV